MRTRRGQMALNSHEALKKAGVRTCQNEMQRVRVANEPEKKRKTTKVENGGKP